MGGAGCRICFDEAKFWVGVGGGVHGLENTVDLGPVIPRFDPQSCV